MADLTINIVKKALSDGSHVYDVAVVDDRMTYQQCCIVNAVTFDDAVSFAECLKTLVERHTVNSARVLDAT
jgi:hypothetical protein